MRPAVILFAKAPEPGRVKTRLQPTLSAEQSAELHASFVRDALELLKASLPESSLQLHTDISTDAWDGLKVAQFRQVNGDLGRRMLHTLSTELGRGRPRVMIVGSDSPTLPIAHLQGLLASESDVAIGPCEDGGYYAISCRRVHPGMFNGVRWSGPEALDDTVRAAEACGLSVELGETWWDVDSPQDLERLTRLEHLPRHTAECLSRLGLRG